MESHDRRCPQQAWHLKKKILSGKGWILVTWQQLFWYWGQNSTLSTHYQSHFTRSRGRKAFLLQAKLKIFFPSQRHLVKVALFEHPFSPPKSQEIPVHCHFSIYSHVWAPENININFSALKWHLPQPPSGLSSSINICCRRSALWK